MGEVGVGARILYTFRLAGAVGLLLFCCLGYCYAVTAVKRFLRTLPDGNFVKKLPGWTAIMSFVFALVFSIVACFFLDSSDNVQMLTDLVITLVAIFIMCTSLVLIPVPGSEFKDEQEDEPVVAFSKVVEEDRLVTKRDKDLFFCGMQAQKVKLLKRAYGELVQLHDLFFYGMQAQAAPNPYIRLALHCSEEFPQDDTIGTAIKRRSEYVLRYAPFFADFPHSPVGPESQTRKLMTDWGHTISCMPYEPQEALTGSPDLIMTRAR